MDIQEIKEKIKALEAPQIAIIVCVLGCVIFIFYGLLKGGDEAGEIEKNTVMELPEDQRAVSNYESKLEAYQKENEEAENSLTLDFDRGLFSEGETVVKDTTNPYMEENDPKVLELQRQIELMEQRRTQNQKTNPSRSTYSAPQRVQTKPKEKTEEELELELYRELRNKKRNPSKIATSTMETGLGTVQSAIMENSVKVRASIYNDHYIFPGDRVSLLLNEDFQYKGKTFKKNTLLYATASFSENRVFLDVSNIQHEQIKMQGIDLQDGELGMYVSQVAEFNQKYNSILEREALGRSSTELGGAVNQRFVGGVISSVGNLFKNKRLKNKDRVFLINDQQVFLTDKFL